MREQQRMISVRSRELLEFLEERGTFLGTVLDLEQALGWNPYTLQNVLTHVRTHADDFGMTVAPVRKGMGPKTWFLISTDGTLLDETARAELQHGKQTNGRDIRTRALGIFQLARIEEAQHPRKSRRGILARELRVQSEALLLHAERYVEEVHG